jgi:hypothetical protein
MWHRWSIVLVLTSATLAAAFWAELHYQPQIYSSHQQQQYTTNAISNSGQKPIFPPEFFVWIDGIVEWTDPHHDFVIALANVFLAAFTLALFFATWGLLRFARIQSDDMRRSIRVSRLAALAGARQARAAVRLAAASELHATVAERSFIDLERPYLFYESIGMDDPITRDWLAPSGEIHRKNISVRYDIKKLRAHSRSCYRTWK